MSYLPQLIAHRGYAAAYPENSLPAFQGAIDLGVKWLECDLQLTADGVPVVVHDANMERVSGRSVNVLAASSSDVLSCSLGEGVNPPTLNQLLALIADHPDVHLFIEFKIESLEAFGVEQVFDRVWPLVGGLEARVVPISYASALVRYARARGAPAVGWVAAQWDEAHHATADALQPDYLFTNWMRLPEEQPLWAGPWQWAVYEVVDPAVAERVVARGIYFIETMNPAALLHQAPFVQVGHV